MSSSLLSPDDYFLIALLSYFRALLDILFITLFLGLLLVELLPLEFFIGELDLSY